MATPGLIDTEINKTDPLQSIKGYEAAQVNIDPSKDTVEGRVGNILESGSPIMRMNETRAKQRMNRKGLLNSSMAVGAERAAAMDYAVPIASQDASQSLQNKQFNVGSENRGFEFTANAQNLAAEGERAGQRSIEQIGAQTEGSSRLQAERGEIEKELQTAEGDIRERLLNRQAEIDRELAEYGTESQSRLQAEQGEIEKQLQTAEGDIRERLLNRQAEINQELQASGFQGEEGLIAARGEIDRQLEELRAQNQGQLTEQQAQIESDLLNQRAAIDERLTGLQAGYEKDLQLAIQDLRGEQAERLSNIEGQYRNILQASSSASGFMSQISASIAEINSNPDIPGSAKRKMIDQQMDLLESHMAVQGGITDLDMTGLLDFSKPSGSGSGGTLEGDSMFTRLYNQVEPNT